jgi:site-specific recombinase XerD
MARSTAKLRAVTGETFSPPKDTPQTASAPVLPASSPVSLYLAGLDETSRKAVRHRLDVVADVLQPGADASTFDWSTVTYRETATVKATLGTRYAWTMANHCLSAMKGVLRTTWSLGCMSTDQFHRAIAVQGYKGSVLPHGRHIGEEEFKALFTALATDDSARGRRDLALFAVARSSGARCEELTNLNLADLDLPSLTIRIDGKGRRERESVLASWCRTPLERYLKVRGTLAGPLFSVLRRNGRVANPPARVTLSGMQNILEKRVAEHGLEPFTWHDLRRSLVSDLLEGGADLRATMLQVGHSNPKTTLRYDRREQKRLQQQARNVASPFGGDARDNAKYDREFDGKPSPWIAEESDLENGDAE